jgi:hypothetical protein
LLLLLVVAVHTLSGAWELIVGAYVTKGFAFQWESKVEPSIRTGIFLLRVSKWKVDLVYRNLNKLILNPVTDWLGGSPTVAARGVSMVQELPASPTTTTGSNGGGWMRFANVLPLPTTQPKESPLPPLPFSEAYHQEQKLLLGQQPQDHNNGDDQAMMMMNVNNDNIVVEALESTSGLRCRGGGDGGNMLVAAVPQSTSTL